MINRFVLLSIVFCIGGFGVNACNVPQFHCDGFDKGYIYSPEQGAEEGCKWLNGTDGYNLCLNEYNKMFRAYEAGECEPILSEKHIEGETSCRAFYYGDRILQRIKCKGPDSEALETKVRELYN